MEYNLLAPANPTLDIARMSVASMPIAAPHASLLLAEDDVRLAKLMCDFLQANGFQTDIEHRGDAVVARVRQQRPALLVLDLGLPGLDGLSICRQLRQDSDIPILMLTARDNDIDHVVGLELGADDYVIKPVEPRVLLARIQALLRRSKQPIDATQPLRFGRLSIDPAARTVTLNEATVALSSNEFELLHFLAMHAGEMQPREMLYQHLYKRAYDGMDRTLDVRISHLRKKLGDDASRPERIKTVWGQGYLFVASAWA